MKEILFGWCKDRGSFLGRNGIMKCRGVRVTANDKDLYIEPFTSKGHVGKCLICIPVEEGKALIEALKEVLK